MLAVAASSMARRRVGYADGIPVVHGTVAAVIRARRNRRLVTYGYGPLIDRSLYIPRALVPARLWDTAASGQCPVVDTSDGADAVAPDEPVVGAHPAANPIRCFDNLKCDPRFIKALRAT